MNNPSPSRQVFEWILVAGTLLAIVALPMAARADSHRPTPPSFSDFDADADGKVTQAEFDAFRAERHAAMAAEGRPMRGMANAPSFADWDADGDGALTEEEFLAGRKARMEAMHAGQGGHGGGMHGGGQRHRMASFEDIDTNGDGCISREELDAHHDARPAPKD